MNLIKDVKEFSYLK